MKANELMTGDWVQVKDCIDQSYYFDEYDPGEIVQVREILDNGINPNWAGAEVSSILGLEDIQPIPITPEILEKNGFECRGAWCLPGEDLGLRQDGDSWGLLSYYTEYDALAFCHIKYVHELQHALRICGIEKDIVL